MRRHSALVFDRHLSLDPGTGLGLRHSTQFQEPPDLQGLGGVDQDNGVEGVCAAALEEQRDVQHHHRIAPLSGLPLALGHPPPDQRVNDPVQPFPGVGVVERNLREPGTIECAIRRDDARAELLGQALQALRPTRLHRPGRLIRVDYGGPQAAQHGGDRALAGGDTPGQAHDLHTAYDVAPMAEEEKLDAIVVGAGPSGAAAAYTMARAGLQVALVEKGVKPGSKNVMGGIFYNYYLEQLVGEDWKEAPLERPIIDEQRWMMTEEAAIGLGYKNLRNREHPHSFSVLRAKFDPWFAGKAEEAGAFLIPETVVEELILKNGRVVGVRTGREGDLYANVVVVCEGIGLGSQLLVKAGLKKPLKPNQAAMAVKEIIALDPAVIESRFNCDPGEGASVECYGAATLGLTGFMFIYTNRDTLSVGGGALLSEMSDTRLTREELARRTPNALLNHFKGHQAIKPLLQGGETVEYLAKMIPEAGYKDMPKLYGNGYLVCGDAAMLSNPPHREGSNLAMESGRVAGETVIRAHERGDFSETTLREYKLRLDHSWIMADMRKYRGAVPLLEHNPQMMGKYPQVLDQAMDEFFRVDGVSKWDKQSKILRMFRKAGLFRMGWDTMKAAWIMLRPIHR